MARHTLGRYDPDKDCIHVVYRHVKIMRAVWTRAIGLIGKKHVDFQCAYLFPLCPSVHTKLMSIPIDVIVCDKHLRVLAVETMQPWQASSPKINGAHTIIEAAAGSAAAAGVVPGELLCEIRNLLD